MKTPPDLRAHEQNITVLTPYNARQTDINNLSKAVVQQRKDGSASSPIHDSVNIRAAALPEDATVSDSSLSMTWAYTEPSVAISFCGNDWLPDQ